LRIVHSEMFLHAVDHFAATGVNDPEANLRSEKDVSPKQRLQHFLDHWPRQVLDRLAKDNAQLSISVLKSNFFDSWLSR